MPDFESAPKKDQEQPKDTTKERVVEGEADISFEDFLSELNEEVGEVNINPAETQTQENQKSDFGTEIAEIALKIEEDEKLQQMIEAERRREQQEKRKRGLEKLAPFYERLSQIADDEKMVAGKLYYGALKGKENAYLEAEAAQLDLRIAQTQTQLKMEQSYATETGESIGGGDPEVVAKKLERELAMLTKKQQKGFSDEEKANFKHYQRGVVSSLEQKGPVIAVINQNHMGYEGTRPVRSPDAFIDQMKRVREYQHSAEYHAGPEGISDERLEQAGRIDDQVSAYDRYAQGMAVAALEDGDVAFAGKALRFAEGVRKMSPEVAEGMKHKIAGLDQAQKKEFIRVFQGV